MKKLLLGLLLLACALSLALLGLRTWGAPDRPGRFPALAGHSFPLAWRAPDGTEIRLQAPAQRILPGNAAWVDFVTLLVPPSRTCALPEAALDYSRLAAEPGPWSGLPRFSGFRSEELLAFEPDLVLAHDWQDPEALASLGRGGVPVFCLPVPGSWQEIQATLVLLGKILGETARTHELLARLEERRSDLAERMRPFAGLRALSYTNLGAGGWMAGSGTTAQVLFELAGLRNAAAELGLTGDGPADQERLIALDPDLFLVGSPGRSESSPPSAQVLRSDPALAGLAAIQADRIVALPAPLFASASPELLRGAERLADEVQRLFADRRAHVDSHARPAGP
jgi:ABC-type Fe3+-hydroxamate transport system substrate-binding protein